MLMQWISKSDSNIDGICYRTTRVPLTHKIKHDRSDDNYREEYPSIVPPILNNYVFPVKCNHKDGHCPELAKIFSYTSPILWSLADIDGSSAIRPQENANRSPGHEARIDRIKITLNDIEIYYGDSVFGKREKTSLSDSFPLRKMDEER